jgi:membrane fusion protein, multidrug efflux system
MKKLALLLVLAAVAAGYYYRQDLLARAPAWVRSYAAKLDPSLAPAKTAAEPPAAAGGHHRGGPAAVTVAVAKEGSLPVLRSTIGTIVATASTALAPEISGTVAKVLVKDGAEVKAGDLLIQLDDRAIRAQIAKDEAQIAKDQATLDNAQASYDRIRHLVETGVSTAQAGDDALAAVKVAQGTLAVDKAAHAVDEVALSNTQIRAPFDGRLGAVQFSAGAFVPAGTKLVRITRMTPVLAQFSLPVSDLSLLRKTRAAGTLVVSVSPNLSEADTGPQEDGPVTFIDNAVDAASATVTLRASLDNDSEVFWPGQPVNVRVQAGTIGPLVLVPNVAVMPHVDGAVVFVVKADGTVESRPVTVALREGAEAGLSAGLKPGEKVVTEGQAAVLPGAKVRVVAPKPAGGGAGAAAGGKRGQADLDAAGAAPVTKS